MMVVDMMNNSDNLSEMESFYAVVQIIYARKTKATVLQTPFRRNRTDNWQCFSLIKSLLLEL